MSSNKPKYYLRPEAGAVPWSKLQSRAQAALTDIIGFLSAAVTSVQVSSDNTIIDTNRASRIFFVSGEPGSGKSTLYLTLKAMLSDNSTTSNKYRDQCPEDLSTLEGKVRWLDTLDLEVSGDEGENLLAAVLVRLIEELTNRGNGSNTVHSQPCEDAIKDLEELATDIGIAWEGNLRARAGELDPDTYSEEVMRTQRARLRINERLKKALDDLAKNGCYGCSEKTLFILPVDDFYLKPHASLQLLRLLRMISIPRVFFLVMGDITTVEALFVEKSLADWTAVAGPEIFAALPQRQDEALGRARELRARYLRKLLPPRQRAVIEVMDWYEALDFKPERLNGKETDGDMLKVDAETPIVGTLKNLLVKRDVDSTADNSSLLTFLISPPLGNETRRELEGDNDPKRKNIRRAREAYTALQILDATSREIMDLWFALNDLQDRKDAPPLLSCVLDFVELVIEEQNFLNETQHGILFGILPTRHYTEQEIYLDMNRLRLQPEQNTWNKVIENDQRQLWIRKHRSWKLGVNTDEGESNEDEGLFAKLPPRQTAWIVLMHDLAWKWNPERVTGNLIEKMCRALNESPLTESKSRSLSKTDDNTDVVKLNVQQLVKLVAKLRASDNSVEDQKIDPSNDINPSEDFQGWAVWLEKSIPHHFPMPGFKTFRELDRFLYVWSKGFEWFNELKKKAEEAEKQLKTSKQAEPPKAQKRANSEKMQWIAKVAEAERIASEAQRQVGIDTQQKLHILLSLWALAGWTVLTEEGYENFAKSGNDLYDWYDWYEMFDPKIDGSLESRFANFAKKIPGFRYNGEDTEIKLWLNELNAFLRKLEKERVVENTSEELNNSLSTTPRGQKSKKNNPRKGSQ
jgi:energy-coupling factor transporter ATP-binding protein EcfA2